MNHDPNRAACCTHACMPVPIEANSRREEGSLSRPGIMLCQQIERHGRTPKSPTCCERPQPRRLASNLREHHREACTTRPAIQHVSLSRTFFGETPKAVSVAYLKSARVTELLIGEQVLQLVSGLDTANLIRIPGSENLRDVGIVPGLDVVIARFPSVNVSLNGVTFIADDESVSV